MSLKDKISSPLEAGPSLLDAHHLPAQLTPALEYASSRLARKSLHLTLVVARRDYQLPPSPVLCSPLGSPASPSQNRFTRHLPRWTRHSSFSSSSSATTMPSMPNSPRSAISSPAYTPMSLEFPRTAAAQQGPRSPRSPMWPLTPMTPLSPPPMTPSTAMSSVPTESSSSYFPMASQHGLRLIYHENLPPKAAKVLQSALAKTSRKSGVGARIAPALSAATCGFTPALINNSVTQNDVLFSSDGLSLVSFDRLYSLKAALSSYSKTGSPLRLEDAVDELRRYVLATGQRVSKAHLLRSYDWLNVSHSALSDLDRMYRRAYGGVAYAGGIDGMYFAPVPESSVWSDDEDEGEDEEEVEYHDQDSGVYVEGLPDSPTLDQDTIGLAISSTPIPVVTRRSPSPKLPLLRVQTSFDKTPAFQGVEKKDPGEKDDSKPNEGDGEEEVKTARPDDEVAAAARSQLWSNAPSTSIDHILTAGPDPPTTVTEIDRSTTPNAYDDISPITRGEWGFLLVDRGFQSARTVAVTTC